MALLVYIISSVYILICPFTKVEESFNMQAVHDILYYRHNLTLYDHNEFPGVVPRTFIGPLFLSVLSSPLVTIFQLLDINKFWTQYMVEWVESQENINCVKLLHLVSLKREMVHKLPQTKQKKITARLTLAMCVVWSWARLRAALQASFGTTFAWWFTLLTVTQYHFMFYMSRLLPNIMAMPLVLLAYEGWMQNKTHQFLILSGAAIILFRAELAMLFGFFLLYDIALKRVSLLSVAKVVVPAGALLVALTVLVDSVFWGRLLWPEAEVLWFNAVLNKSSIYGTSPFLWYWYSALPRGLGPSLALVPLGVYLDRRTVPLLVPAALYLLLYSFLPHKELRFVIYVFPLFNVAAASACTFVYNRRKKAPIYELLFWGVVMCIIGNMALSAVFVSVASTNYPGGLAIRRFHRLVPAEGDVHVHIDNLAAQTGVTRFTQLHDRWRYGKNESLAADQLQVYTHLLVEARSKYSTNLKPFAKTHDVLDAVEGFSQVSINYKLIPPVKIKTKPSIFILERHNWRDGPVPSQDSDESDDIKFDSLDSLNNEDAIADNDQMRTDELDSSETYRNDIEIGESAERSRETTDDGLLAETAERTNSNTDDLDLLETNLFAAETGADDVYSDLEEERANRFLMKAKAVEKIKAVTKSHVLASAKEKLKRFIKEHKTRAAERAGEVVTQQVADAADEGAQPTDSSMVEDVDLHIEESVDEALIKDTNELVDGPHDESTPDLDPNVDAKSISVDVIVEEVIAKLVERRLLDEQRSLRAEEREVIKQIVEAVLTERLRDRSLTQAVPQDLV